MSAMLNLSNSPKVSIVLPTRDRLDTLQWSLATCLAQDFDGLEIVVSDNASVDGTRDFVMGLGDSRVRYVNPGTRLSMARSFEFAFANARGDLLVSIGDDDGLARGAISRVYPAFIEAGVDAVTCERAHYDWPSMTGAKANQLLFSRRAGFERRHTEDYLPGVLNGWTSYYQVPVMYQGFFSRRLLELVRARTGRIFHSQQIDMYSAVVCSVLTPVYLHARESLIINGASARSNGAQHFGKTQDQSEVRNWNAENDLPLLPPFEFVKSIRLLVGESYAQARLLYPELAAYAFDTDAMIVDAMAEVATHGATEQLDAIARIATALEGAHLPSPFALKLARLRMKAHRYLAWAARFRSSMVVNCAPHGVTHVDSAAALMQRLRTEDHWKLGEQLRLAASRR